MLDITDLENINFEWGEEDCFALIRKLYLKNFGIVIRDYARPTNWSEDVSTIILQAYEREGFEKIANWKLKDIRPADVMVMCVGHDQPNHFAAYIGNNEFIHHLTGNLSRVSPLKGHWLHHTAFLLRHPDVPDLRPVGKDTPIEELLRARYQIETDGEA